MTSNGKQPTDVVILSGARTPVGRFNGALAGVAAAQLGGIAIRAAVERAGIDAQAVDEVLMGQVISAGAGQAPARQAAIAGGIPARVGATTLNKVCGSGLKSVMLASQAIRAGDAQLILAGGMEAMSEAPYLLPEMRRGSRYGHTQVLDSLTQDGLWCSFEQWLMGDAAEFIAEQFEVTREQMDEFAFQSHQKAIAALDACKFKDEIVPVEAPGRKGKVTVVDTDESPRRDTSLEVLANLRPAFRRDGKVTAGNAPGLNDGAAAVVVSSRAWADAHGVKPLARIVAYGQAAVEPRWIFDAPSKAVPLVLDKVGWSLADLDLVELNEAFASQALANGRALADQGWDWEKVNVNGGAIALGHPLGATGARLLVTLLYALRDRGGQRGLASMCLGGGEAVGMLVEMED